MEIDHVVWFLPSLATIEPELTGFTVESGQRHLGQGTANRRIFFERNYLELLWIDEPTLAAASVLGFTPRCARAAGACPFGVVLRGELPTSARAAFTSYEVPGSGGFCLQLLTSSLHHPEQPFVAVFETPAPRLAARWPSTHQPASLLSHRCGATQLAHASFSAPAPAFASAPPPEIDRALLAALALRDVTFAAPPSPSSSPPFTLTLSLTSLAHPVQLAEVHLAPHAAFT